MKHINLPMLLTIISPLYGYDYSHNPEIIGEKFSPVHNETESQMRKRHELESQALQKEITKINWNQHNQEILNQAQEKTKQTISMGLRHASELETLKNKWELQTSKNHKNDAKEISNIDQNFELAHKNKEIPQWLQSIKKHFERFKSVSNKVVYNTKLAWNNFKIATKSKYNKLKNRLKYRKNFSDLKNRYRKNLKNLGAQENQLNQEKQAYEQAKNKLHEDIKHHETVTIERQQHLDQAQENYNKEVIDLEKQEEQALKDFKQRHEVKQSATPNPMMLTQKTAPQMKLEYEKILKTFETKKENLKSLYEHNRAKINSTYQIPKIQSTENLLPFIPK